MCAADDADPENTRQTLEQGGTTQPMISQALEESRAMRQAFSSLATRDDLTGLVTREDLATFANEMKANAARFEDIERRPTSLEQQNRPR
jgi:hypothetical protein